MKTLRIICCLILFLIPFLIITNVISSEIALTISLSIVTLIYILSSKIETTKCNKTKKTDLMTCPHCGSIDAKLLAADTDCEYPEWTYKCKDCGTEWTEYAELKYAGYHLKE